MAIAADVFFGEPTKELTVAGVTGTNGKTTTAYLLWSILDADGQRPGLLGTVESRVGGEVRPVVRTTPEAIDLQRTFRADARRRRPQRRARGLVARVDAAPARSRPLRRARVHEPDPGPSRLPRDDGGLLRRQAPPFHGRGAAPGRREHRRRAGAPARRGARGDPAGAARHVRVRRRRRDPSRGPSARCLRRALPGAEGSTCARPLRGRFNVENVLGAVAAAQLLDIDDEAIAAGARRARGCARTVRGRRRGAAVHSACRLRAHTGLARQRPALGPRPHHRAAARRLRCGRRPRSRQAPVDGQGRGRPGRPRGRDLRQPAQRGAARDHPGRPPGHGDGRGDRSGPPQRDPAGAVAGAVRATSS